MGSIHGNSRPYTAAVPEPRLTHSSNRRAFASVVTEYTRFVCPCDSIHRAPLSAPCDPRGEPPRLPSERLDVPVAQVARKTLDHLVVNVAPPERLEGLNDGAGYGRAVEKASVGPAPQLNCARTVAVRLVGAAAHIHVARRNLVVKPQSIERRAARVKRTPRT